MVGISAIQRILDNQLTSKFARTLKHSDLPEGWADNPEIVALAEDAYGKRARKARFSRRISRSPRWWTKTKTLNTFTTARREATA